MSRKFVRRGFSLIELLTVIFVSTILFSTSATVLRRVYVIQSHSMRRVARLETLARFRNRLCNDIQAASRGSASQLLELFHGQSRIVYQVVDQSIIREKLLNETRLSIDSWRFSDPVHVTWSMDRSSPIALVTADIKTGPAVATQAVLAPAQWMVKSRLGGQAVEGGLQ